MTFIAKSKLPRLAREWYQGRAVVFWTHTFEHRATGWLSGQFHAAFREGLLHANARHELACPTYTLMPDHWHLVWMGLAATSDQRLATAFLREHLSPRLGNFKLQDRAHDHVLREEKRKRGAFESTCHYVRDNPVRAGLCADWKQWPYSGAMVAGYPDLDPREDDFWPRYWRIYAFGRVARRVSGGRNHCEQIPALTRRATPPETSRSVSVRAHAPSRESCP